MLFAVAATDLYLSNSSPSSGWSWPSSSNFTPGKTVGFPDVIPHTSKFFSTCLGSASHHNSSARHSTARPKMTQLFWSHGSGHKIPLTFKYFAANTSRTHSRSDCSPSTTVVAMHDDPDVTPWMEESNDCRPSRLEPHLFQSLTVFLFPNYLPQCASHRAC